MNLSDLPFFKNVSRETIDKLHFFQALYLKWGKKTNLSSRHDLDDLAVRHIIDSYQISSIIGSLNHQCLDVGSGGGFPGVILSIIGHPIALCEIDLKKIIFLEEVRRQLNLKYELVTNDAFAIQKSFDVVTARAFTSLVGLLQIQKNVSRETTVGIFPKGKTYAEEIMDAQKKWNFDYNLIDSCTNDMSKIVVVQNVGEKNG